MAKDIIKIIVVGANESLSIVDLELQVSNIATYSLRLLSSAAEHSEIGLRLSLEKLSLEEIENELEKVGLLTAIPFLTLQR